MMTLYTNETQASRSRFAMESPPEQAASAAAVEEDGHLQWIRRRIIRSLVTRTNPPLGPATANDRKTKGESTGPK
jgi:hypothetical protein